MPSCIGVKVREVIAQLEFHGWYHVAQTGSDRQFKHPVRDGRVTVAGPEGSSTTCAMWADGRSALRGRDGAVTVTTRYLTTVAPAGTNARSI